MAGGPRPTPAQGPPMVHQHAHTQQPHLVPMMQNPGAPAQFTQGPNFIPLQHPQRPIMNGIPPGAHQQNFSIQQNPNSMQLARPSQIRQFQNGIPGQLGIYQVPPGMHSHQLQQMQQMQQQMQQQQANPALRLTPQIQMVPQPTIPQQNVPGPGMQHIQGPRGPQPVLLTRYIHCFTPVSLQCSPNHLAFHRFVQFAGKLSATHTGVQPPVSFRWPHLENEWELLVTICKRLVCSGCICPPCSRWGATGGKGVWYILPLLLINARIAKFTYSPLLPLHSYFWRSSNAHHPWRSTSWIWTTYHRVHNCQHPLPPW